MKIGNRNYKVKRSDCWLVFPARVLTVNVWTNQKMTYLIVEPIKFDNPQNLIVNQFQSEFLVKEIGDLDSTLLENDKAVNIWNLEVKFDSHRLFKLSKVSIKGKTENGEEVELNTETSFSGFEIWKENDYQFIVTEIESILNNISIPYKIIDEAVNDIVRIKINRA